MKYFCRDHEREGTCYHEFQRGKWDGSSHWKADSLCIHDDVMIEIGLDALLARCIPGYDPWGPTAVLLAQWNEVCRLSKQSGGPVAEAMVEADRWVRADAGMTEFTILGI